MIYTHQFYSRFNCPPYSNSITKPNDNNKVSSKSTLTFGLIPSGSLMAVPFESLEEIFYNTFSFGDWANCRRVCKNWNKVFTFAEGSEFKRLENALTVFLRSEAFSTHKQVREVTLVFFKNPTLQEHALAYIQQLFHQTTNLPQTLPPFRELRAFSIAELAKHRLVRKDSIGNILASLPPTPARYYLTETPFFNPTQATSVTPTLLVKATNRPQAQPRNTLASLTPSCSKQILIVIGFLITMASLLYIGSQLDKSLHRNQDSHFQRCLQHALEVFNNFM